MLIFFAPFRAYRLLGENAESECATWCVEIGSVVSLLVVRGVRNVDVSLTSIRGASAFRLVGLCEFNSAGSSSFIISDFDADDRVVLVRQLTIK